MSQIESKKHLIYILGTFAFFLFTIADTIIKLIGDFYKDTVIFSIASLFSNYSSLYLSFI